MILSLDTFSTPAASWHSESNHQAPSLMPMLSRPVLKINFQEKLFLWQVVLMEYSLAILSYRFSANNPSRVMSSGIYFSVIP